MSYCPAFFCVFRFLDELNAKIQKDHRENSTFPKITKNPRKDEWDERRCRGKDKKQLEGTDEKVNRVKAEKTKGKQPPKMSKTTRQSEPLTSTKQSKTGSKVIQNAAHASMKSTAGKAAGVESKRDSEIPILTKTLTLDLSETSRTAASPENSSARPKQEKALSPDTREGHENVVSSATEKSTLESSRLCKLESSQDTEKKLDKTSKKVSTLLKHSTNGNLNFSLSPKPSVESATNWSNTSLPLKSSQLGSKDHTEVRTSAGVEHLTGPKVLSSNPKPSRSVSKMNSSTSKSHTPDLPTQSSTVSMEASPPHSNKVLPKELLNAKSKIGSSYKGLPEHSHLREDNDIKEDMQMLHYSDGDYKQNPESSCLHQQISTEARTTSNEMVTLRKTPNVSDKENREDLAPTVSIRSTASSVVDQTTNASGSSGTEKPNISSAFESDEKVWIVPQCKSLVGAEFKTKSRSFSDHMRSTVFPQTQRATLATDHSKMNETPEILNKTNISSVPDLTLVTSTETLQLKALTRSSILHNKDSANLNEYYLGLSCSSPPPPSSSIPLLLPPSSTSLVNSSIIRTHSSAVSDHSSLGPGSHPRTPAVRYSTIIKWYYVVHVGLNIA